MNKSIVNEIRSYLSKPINPLQLSPEEREYINMVRLAKAMGDAEIIISFNKGKRVKKDLNLKMR